MRSTLAVVACLLATVIPSPAAQTLPDRWPGFRGDGTGHTGASGLPVEWSDSSGVEWRIVLEGPGQSTPPGARGYDLEDSSLPTTARISSARTTPVTAMSN
jgi:hypothetical protein